MCIIFKIVNPTFKQTASNETVINWHNLECVFFNYFYPKRLQYSHLQFCSFAVSKLQNRKTANRKP